MASVNAWTVLQRYGALGARLALYSRVDMGRDDQCWNFRGATGNSGYGRMRFGGTRLQTHRAAWALANCADPGELLVCHKCDNPLCCNPAHLFLGTPRENTRDMIAKGRKVNHTAPRKRAKGPKLTAADAAAIRADERPDREIATAYGISPIHVDSIKKGRVWSAHGRAERRLKRAPSQTPATLLAPASPFHGEGLNR